MKKSGNLWRHKASRKTRAQAFRSPAGRLKFLAAEIQGFLTSRFREFLIPFSRQTGTFEVQIRKGRVGRGYTNQKGR